MSYLNNLLLISTIFFLFPWIEKLSEKIKISYSLLIVIVSTTFYYTSSLITPLDPIQTNTFIVHFTELIVIISLMNAGLSIDKDFSLKRWKKPILLVTVGMGLFMIATFFLSKNLLGLGTGSALLLMSVLAPTDPVLASDVQVSPPNQYDPNKSRLSLSIEAGLNDGLAFPFVWLAIVYINNSDKANWILEWFLNDLIYKLITGLISGYVFGRITAFLFFKLPKSLNLTSVRYGLVALSATLLTYSFTEIIGGYGFIAVFIAAIAIRNYEISHSYHNKLHEFNSQIEHSLLIIALVFTSGTALDYLSKGINWEIVLFSLITILIVRPISAFISIDQKLDYKNSLLISFFGIKGIGSLFYLSYALSKAEFADPEILWTITFTTLLASLVIHGLTAPSLFKKYSSQKATEVASQ